MNHSKRFIGGLLGLGLTALAVSAAPAMASGPGTLKFDLSTISVLEEAGCALVGGHTGEGQELALGFAINGLIDESLAHVMRKGGMKAGDSLILTKPCLLYTSDAADE